MNALALDGGFAEPVFGAQEAFRALMDALANPGQPQALGHDIEHAPGLSAELAAVALTMCDHDTLVWLDPVLAGIRRCRPPWLRFQTGAPITDDAGRDCLRRSSPIARRNCRFLSSIASRSAATNTPIRSTTIALALPALTGGPALTSARSRHKGHADDRAGRPARRFRRAMDRQPGTVPARRRPAVGRRWAGDRPAAQHPRILDLEG